MSKKMLNITSHQLTPSQVEELKTDWSVTVFVELPDDLLSLVNQIQRDTDITSVVEVIMAYAEKVLDPDDYVFIQGQHDFTIEMVLAAMKQYIPIYAFSTRISQEIQLEGRIQKTSIFEHVTFKLYTTYVKRMEAYNDRSN